MSCPYSLFFGLIGPLKNELDVWRAGSRVTESQRLLHALMEKRDVQGRVEADDAAPSVINADQKQSALKDGTEVSEGGLGLGRVMSV